MRKLSAVLHSVSAVGGRLCLTAWQAYTIPDRLQVGDEVSYVDCEVDLDGVYKLIVSEVTYKADHIEYRLVEP